MESEVTCTKPDLGPHALDLRRVMNELGSVVSKWFQIGIQLGVSETRLHHIEADYRIADRCLSEVIILWLNGNANTDVTWESLIRALEASIVNEKGLAKSLIQKYGDTTFISKRHTSSVEPEAKRRRLETDTALPLKAQDLEIARVISKEQEDNTTFTKPCLTFPCLDLKNMAKEEKEKLHQRLHSDSVNMMCKFQELYSSTSKSLKERKIPITEMLCHLVGMGPMKPTFNDLSLPAFRCQLPGLKEAKNTDDVMLVVGDYCSFFNLQMLECIIDKVGTDQDRKNLSQYKEEFNQYAQRHVFECPSNVGKVSEEGHVNMFVILDETYDNCTVSQLQLFVAKLQEILSISPGDGLKLCHIAPGSLRLTFQLPASIANHIFPLSSEQEAVLSSEGVHKLWLIYQFTAEKKEEKKVETTADSSSTNMKEPDDDASITDSAFGSCSVVTGSTFIGTFQQYREKESSDRKLENFYKNMEHEFDIRAKLLSPGESSILPLHRAAYRGDIETVKRLLEESRHNPLQMDSYGNTAVHYAAAGGSLLSLKYFIEERQCSAACLNMNQQTPLHFAAEHKHLELVKYLVANQQMDPMIQDKHGVTILHAASVGGDIQIIHYLINELTKYSPLHDVMNERVEAGNAPIHFAALYGHLNVVRLFITEFKCDPSILGWWDRTPLHASAQEGHLEVARYLVDEEKCDVSCYDKDEVTPLHLAAAKGQLDTVKYLTERGGNPLVNKINDTPLHWAAEFGQLEITKYFVETLNCSVELKGHLNMTPLEKAGRNGHIHVTQYLCQLCQEL